MEEFIYLGRGRQMQKVPAATWMKHLDQTPEHAASRLGFMTEAHTLVRNFVVVELAVRQQPLEASYISEQLSLPIGQVEAILDELEKKLFFLVRNQRGMVSWAYPVTVEPTPHRVTFASGEQLYAAWAEDALAAPFVEGKLQKKLLTAEIESTCRHCDQSLHVSADSAMNVSVREHDASPLVFMPDVDWNHFTEKTIIDTYWRNTVFFWSEEHAREYRMNINQVDGIYLTLQQCAYLTPIAQGSLFGFK